METINNITVVSSDYLKSLIFLLSILEEETLPQFFPFFLDGYVKVVALSLTVFVCLCFLLVDQFISQYFAADINKYFCVEPNGPKSSFLDVSLSFARKGKAATLNCYRYRFLWSLLYELRLLSYGCSGAGVEKIICFL